MYTGGTEFQGESLMSDRFDKKEQAFLEELRHYENSWVAIFESEDEEKVVGSGSDAVQATREAEANGFKEAIMFYVGSFDSGYIPRA
jgi:hypothetical protein